MFKVNDFVRVLAIKDPEDPNAFAIVYNVYEDGRVWITNLNMPFMGSISDIVDPSEIRLVNLGFGGEE